MTYAIRITAVLLMTLGFAVGCTSNQEPVVEQPIIPEPAEETLVEELATETEEMAEAEEVAPEEEAMEEAEETDSDQSIIGPDENVSALKQTYYIAERDGDQTHVRLYNTETQTSEEVFSFTEYRAYDQGSANLYKEARPSVDYSEATNEFVYASGEGLYIFNPETEETTTIIDSTPGETTIDGVLLRNWSIDFTGHNDTWNPYGITLPQFSDNGQYISFVASYYEGSETVVYSRDGGLFQLFESRDENEQLFSSTTQWIPNTYGELFVLDGSGFGAIGAFYAAPGAYSNAEDIMDLNEGPPIAYYTGLMLRNGDSTVIYGKEGNTETNEESEFGIFTAGPDTYNVLMTFPVGTRVEVDAVQNTGAVFHTTIHSETTYYWYTFDSGEAKQILESYGNHQHYIEEITQDSIIAVAKDGEGTRVLHIDTDSLEETTVYSSANGFATIIE